MNSKDIYLRLLGYVKPYWRTFTVAIIGMVITAATEPALPALMKPMLDGSFVDKDPRMMRLIPLLLIGVFLVRGVAGYMSDVATKWVSQKVVMDIRNAMFDRLLTLPHIFFDKHPSGTLISRLTYNVDQVATTSTDVLVIVVKDGLAIIGLLAWMFWLNWKLSLIAFIIAPVIALIVVSISRRLRQLSRSLQNTAGEMVQSLEESISGIRVVKVFGGQAQEKEHFHHVTNWLRRYVMKVATISAANTPVVQLVTVLALAAIIYIASLQSASNQLTVGGFVSFFGAMAMLLAPIKRLTRVNEQLQRGLAAAENIFAFLDTPAEADTGSQTLTRAQGRLEFRHVGFRYPGASQDALSDFCLDIEPGETVALVGQSGSGKSTLASLIPRFHLPDRGTILLDGIDINDIRLADLRRQIALVSQDVVLFNDTIAANIAYGAPDAREADILAAAEAAHAMEFIHQLPDGLNTSVGERGSRLSGGQKQRIAIARALLKNAPILIMDEATSALDTESERQVQLALETLRQRCTAIIIAHRLSTIENADRIVVMDKGRIIEIGNHRALLERGGAYARLYRAQFSEDAAIGA